MTCAVYVKWKRGHKKHNSGQTGPATCIDRAALWTVAAATPNSSNDDDGGGANVPERITDSASVPSLSNSTGNGSGITVRESTKFMSTMVRDRQTKQFDSKKIMFLLKSGDKKSKLESILGTPSVTVDLVNYVRHQQSPQTQIVAFQCASNFSGVGPTMVLRIRCEWLRINNLTLRPTTVASNEPSGGFVSSQPNITVLSDSFTAPPQHLDYIILDNQEFQLVDLDMDGVCSLSLSLHVSYNLLSYSPCNRSTFVSMLATMVNEPKLPRSTSVLARVS